MEIESGRKIANTFSDFINCSVDKFGHLNAIGFVGESALTYTELGNKIDALIAFFEKMGITQTDKIAILGQNMPNWVIAYLAVQKMGAIAVPILPDFTPVEIENILNHSETQVLLVSEELSCKIEGISIKSVNTTIDLNSFKVLNGKYVDTEYNDTAQPLNTYRTDPEKLAILLYTSGTTGGSKGVMLSQRNVLYNVYQCYKVQKIVPGDKFLSILPLSHTYENTLGMLLPLTYGAQVFYIKKPPTPSVLLDALKKVRPTIMLSVPLIIEKIYRNRVLPEIQKKAVTKFLYHIRPFRYLLHRVAGKKLYATFGNNLKFFGIGGSKLDAKVERFLRDAKFPYAIGYGLTETSPFMAGSNPQQTKFQAIGTKVVDAEIMLNDIDPITNEGEIWLKGPNVMLGYFKNEKLTSEVLTPDGWFKSGDLGKIDPKGVLTHKGRIKNVIIGANGKNVYPEEIESVINNFKHVAESIVLERKGKLVAMVHFNREELEKSIDERLNDISNKVDKLIDDLARELQAYINDNVNKFSRINMLIIQKQPFKKTATQKIKRYLYT